MLAVYKLRAALINVNYRYTASEIRYVLDNADVVALVHDRTLRDRRSPTRCPARRSVKHVVVLDDEIGRSRSPASTTRPRSPRAAPSATSSERSNDDLYILYTGGTTGMPKGVIWRHEDVWRTLGGGINFVTGEPLENEFAQAEIGKVTGGMVRLCLAPLIHGNAQWAALMALFGGDTVVLLPQFDPDEVWQAVAAAQGERHRADRRRDGPADDRGVRARRLRRVERVRGLEQRGVVLAERQEPVPRAAAEQRRHRRDRLVRDRLHGHRHGDQGQRARRRAARGSSRRGHASSSTSTASRSPPGTDEIGRLARGGYVPLGYYKDPEKTARAVRRGRRQALHRARRLRPLRGRRHDHVARPRQHVREHRRREGVPRRGRERAHVAPGRVRRAGDRRPGRAARPAGRGGRRSRATGTTPSLDDLAEHVRTELAGYKVPRSIWLVDEVHRLATGKADYRWARNYATDHPEDALCAPRSATSSA